MAKDKEPLIHCAHCGSQTWVRSDAPCGVCSGGQLPSVRQWKQSTPASGEGRPNASQFPLSFSCDTVSRERQERMNTLTIPIGTGSRDALQKLELVLNDPKTEYPLKVVAVPFLGGTVMNERRSLECYIDGWRLGMKNRGE